MLPKDYVQEKAFIRWVNHQLRTTSRSIQNLDQDFKDGVNLCFLLEALTKNRQHIPFHKSPSNFSQKTENVHLALSFLTTAMGMKSYGFNAKDVETGNKKTMLGLIFQLVNKYQISKVLGLDQDKPSIATAKNKLLGWCQTFATAKEPPVANFDSSFHSGRAFHQILSHYHPNHPSLQLTTDEFYEPTIVAAKCFDFAAENGIPKLLDPEDLWQLSKADDSAVVLYISYLFCWLEKPPQPPEEALPMGQYVLTRNTVYGSVSNLSTVSRRGMSTLGASSGAGSPSVARRQNSRPALPTADEFGNRVPTPTGSNSNLDEAASRAALEERSALLSGRLKELRRQLVRVRMDTEAEAARELLEKEPKALILIENRDDEFDDASSPLSPLDPKNISVQVTVCQEKIEQLETQINELQTKLRRRRSRKNSASFAKTKSVYKDKDSDRTSGGARIGSGSGLHAPLDAKFSMDSQTSVASIDDAPSDSAENHAEDNHQNELVSEPRPLEPRVSFLEEKNQVTGSGVFSSNNMLSSTMTLQDPDANMSTTHLNAIISEAAGGSNLPLQESAEDEEEEVDENGQYIDGFGNSSHVSDEEAAEDGTTAVLSDYDLITDEVISRSSSFHGSGTPGSTASGDAMSEDRRSVLKSKAMPGLVVSIPAAPVAADAKASHAAAKATLSPNKLFKKNYASSPLTPGGSEVPLSPRTERSIATQRPLSDLFFRKPTQYPRVSPYPNTIAAAEGFRIEDGTEAVWWLVQDGEKGEIPPQPRRSNAAGNSSIAAAVAQGGTMGFRREGSVRGNPSPLAAAVAAIAAARSELPANLQHRGSASLGSGSPGIPGVTSLQSPEPPGSPQMSPSIDGSDTMVNVPLPVSMSAYGRSLIHASLLENPDYEIKWYHKHFYEKEHDVFIAESGDFGPMIIAVMREEYEDLGQNTSMPFRQYRLIIFLKTGSLLFTVPLPEEKPTLTIHQLLTVVRPDIAETSKNFRSVHYKEIGPTLVNMETAQAASSFKFGVLFVKNGQTKEEDMFGNEEGSPEFDEFLSILGDKIELNGWNKFRGGLDNKNGKTGTHSVYTEFCGHEIMFHVSTLLPYNPNDPQQLERKRHIGNDICCVVFEDAPADAPPSFSPPCISSHFLHIFAGVRTIKSEKGEKMYTINVSCKNDVPEYGPVLPNPPFFNAQQLRRFLLTKLVNAELAACEASTFTSKLVRTLGQLLDNANKEFVPGAKGTKKVNANKTCSTSKKVSLVGMRSNTNPDFASMNMSCFKSPTLLNEIPYEITSMDCLGTNFIIGSAQGLFYYDGVTTTEIKGNKPRKYLQIKVVPELKIIITLGVRQGGKNYILIFDIDSVMQHLKEGTKVKETKIVPSRTTNFFAIDEHYNQDKPLYLIASLGKTQLCFIWQSISKSFRKIESLYYNEFCRVLNVSGSMLMMGFQDKFVCVNIDIRSSLIVYLPQNITYGGRIDPRAVVSLPEEFICHYNNVSIFVDKEGKQSRNYVIKWTGVCHSIIYAFPFLVGLMRDRSEIRSLINGRLIASIPINSYDYLAKSTIPGRGTSIFFSRVYTKKSIISHLDVSPVSIMPATPKSK